MSRGVTIVIGADIRALSAALGRASSELAQFASRTASVFAGNVMARAFTEAGSAAENFFRLAAKGSQDLIQSQRFLASVTAEVGGSFKEASAEASAFARDFATTTSAAQRILAQSNLSLQQAGSPSAISPAALARAVGDLAAARGRSQTDIPDILRTIISGEDEGLNRLGLPNPSVIVANRAAARGLSPDSLTEQQKRLEILKAVLEAAQKNAGAAAAVLDTFPGKVQAITARFEDFAAKVGEAFGRNKGVQSIAQGLLDFFNKYTSDTNAFEQALTKIGPTIVQVAQGLVELGRAGAKAIEFGKTLLSTYQDVFTILIVGAERAASTFADQFVAAIEGGLASAARAIADFIQTTLPDLQGARTLAESIPDSFGGNLLRGAADALSNIKAGSSSAADDLAAASARARQSAADTAASLDPTIIAALGRLDEAGKKMQGNFADIDKTFDQFSKNAEIFGKFDPAAKGIDLVGDAAKRTEVAVKSMADALITAADAGEKSFGDRSKIAERFIENRGRLAALASPFVPSLERGTPGSISLFNNQFGGQGPTPTYGGFAPGFRATFRRMFGVTPESLGVFAPGSQEENVADVFDAASRAGDPTNPNTALYRAQLVADKLKGVSLNTIARAGFAGEYGAALERVQGQLTQKDAQEKQKQSENTSLLNTLLKGLDAAVGGDVQTLATLLKAIPQLVQKLDELPAVATIIAKASEGTEIESFALAGTSIP